MFAIPPQKIGSTQMPGMSHAKPQPLGFLGSSMHIWPLGHGFGAIPPQDWYFGIRTHLPIQMFGLLHVDAEKSHTKPLWQGAILRPQGRPSWANAGAERRRMVRHLAATISLK